MSTLKRKKTPEQKELESIARFYKDCEHGFATKDGYYAIPVMGSNTKLCIVHEGAIIKRVGTSNQLVTLLQSTARLNEAHCQIPRWQD